MEIGDADIYFKDRRKKKPLAPSKLDSLFEKLQLNKALDELVICYKAIWINTFTVFVVALDNQGNLGESVIRHEIFHNWESHIKGFLLLTNDFIILSKNGATVLCLEK